MVLSSHLTRPPIVGILTLEAGSFSRSFSTTTPTQRDRNMTSIDQNNSSDSHDAEVLPTLLCSACLDPFTGDPERFEYNHRQEPYSEIKLPRRMSHHTSLSNFRAAVQEGCYICSRVNEQMNDKIQDALKVEYGGIESAWAPFSGYKFSRLENLYIIVDFPPPIRPTRPEYVTFILFSLSGIPQFRQD